MKTSICFYVCGGCTSRFALRRTAGNLLPKTCVEDSGSGRMRVATGARSHWCRFLVICGFVNGRLGLVLLLCALILSSH